jgi:hypothetical protein
VDDRTREGRAAKARNIGRHHFLEQLGDDADADQQARRRDEREVERRLSRSAEEAAGAAFAEMLAHIATAPIPIAPEPD